MNGRDSSSSLLRKGRVVVLMGVSGVGKTTVGREVARRLGWDFVDADALHSAEALGKMSSGVALEDGDREPWLKRLGTEIRVRVERGADTILACSALREQYRRTLAGDHSDGVVFVFLRASRDVLERRLAARLGHFFGPELLESQLRTLEEPVYAITVDASAAPGTVAEAVVRAIGPRPRGRETA